MRGRRGFAVGAVVWLTAGMCGGAPALNETGPTAAIASTAVESEDWATQDPSATCGEHRRLVHSGATLAERQAAMAREVLAYQALVEEALAMRAGAIRMLDELREKTGRGEALSGRDLQQLNQGAAAMLAQRAALFRVSLSHECWLNDPVPADADEARLQASGIAMSLSAALVLYDNYISAISLFRSEPKLRQHLNRTDSGFALAGQQLNVIAASFASAENRSRVRRGLVWFERHGRRGAVAGDAADEGYRYLAELIEQSPSRHIVRQARPVEFLGNMFGFFSTLGVDTLFGLEREGVHVWSLLFGNAVGLVEARRGKLDARADVLRKVTASARAGDILLEKTPFRLTDAFIPGHWGHVAVWVGTEAELRALGIWEHPAVRPHHAAIRTGRGVVEALRSGVEMNTLAKFLNVDDLALLRQEALPDERRAELIVQALRQVGKGYDFNFDVESTDRIVCSELVYHSYVHLDWPTQRQLGRVTISPDNVAMRATGRGPLSVALLYHDGEEIADARDEAMARLVGAPGVSVASAQGRE